VTILVFPKVVFAQNGSLRKWDDTLGSRANFTRTGIGRARKRFAKLLHSHAAATF
jgi:hypothetical protein